MIQVNNGIHLTVRAEPSRAIRSPTLAGDDADAFGLFFTTFAEKNRFSLSGVHWHRYLRSTIAQSDGVSQAVAAIGALSIYKLDSAHSKASAYMHALRLYKRSVNALRESLLAEIGPSQFLPILSQIVLLGLFEVCVSVSPCGL